MRSLPRPGNEKSNHNRRKVTKKKRTSWNFRNKMAIESLANINKGKATRTHKSRGEGNWDLVPKDSCEVYKERRRRQAEKGQPKLESSASEESYRTKERVPKKADKSNKKKKSNVKPRRKRRARSDSSVPSYTCSDTSMGTSCATASSSEDYE